MRRLFALAAPLLAVVALPASAAADPQLSICAAPVSVVEYTPVTFNAQPLVQGESLTWDFGDGSAPQVQVGPSITHTFIGARQYSVTVTEKDAGGTPTGTGSCTVDVSPYRITVTADPTQQKATPAPYPAPLPTGVPPGFQFPLMSARAKPRRMAVGRAAVEVRCMWATGACHGMVVLRSAKPVRAHAGRKARVVELGREAITVAPQTTATVALAVPRRMRALVKHVGHLSAVAVVTVHDGAGNTADDTVTLTLTR